MGKEWLYRGGGGRSTKGGRLGGGGGAQRDTPSGCMSAVFQLFDFHQFQFALHQEVPSFKPDDSFLPEEPTLLKGVEAPRNSLEMDQEGPFREAASFPSSTMKEEDTLNIPMGIQIKTCVESKFGAPKARTEDLSSECSSSPGAKTPNLVARLMGLDLLPDSCSPSSSSSHHSKSKSHHHQLQNLKQEIQHRQLTQCRSSSGRSFLDADVTGSRSLPETPRISSARRSDVDHRLSLQINKENIAVSEEFEFPGHSAMKTARRRQVRQEDESRSPGHYARQIVKQVKESVSRKVGMDITNTIRNKELGERDDHVVLLKAKKPSKGLARVGDGSSPSTQKQSTPSCSPRLRFLEVKNKPVATTPTTKNQLAHSPKLSSSPLSMSSSVDTQPRSGKVSSKPKSQAPLQNQNQNQNQKCKSIASERYGPRLKKPPQTSDVFRNKQEEPFVRSSSATNRANLSEKKCKKTPLSSELLNINVPTLFPVKKEPSSPTTKLPQKQVCDALSLSKSSGTQLSSCWSQTYRQEATPTPTLTVQNSCCCHHDSCNGGTTGGRAEFQYITGILKRTGIDINTPLSFTNWYSPSHPLDPSIFHHLELSFPAATKDSHLSRRCNRKLIFQLVDEILVEILKPSINLKPWISSSAPCGHQMNGSQLIDMLCSKIRSFPSADCQVLEDIDALIDKDVRRSELRRSMAFEEEGEAIVAELERELVQSLVHETAVEVLFGG